MSRVAARCSAYRHGSMRTLREEILSDLRRFMTKSQDNLSAPDDLLHRVSAFCTPQILAQALYRTAHYCFVRQWLLPAAILARVNSLVHKVNIPPQSCIGPGLHMPHPCGVTFCGSAGSECTIYSLATAGADTRHADGPINLSPFLGNRVTLAAHEALMGPITVGDDVKTALFTFRMDFDVPSGVMVRSRAKRPTLHNQPGHFETFRRPSPEVDR